MGWSLDRYNGRRRQEMLHNGRDSWIKGQQLLNLGTKTRRSKSWKKRCEFDRPGAVQLRNGIATPENNGPVRNAGNSGNEMLSPCKRLTNNGRDSWIKGQQLLNLVTKTRRSKSWKKMLRIRQAGCGTITQMYCNAGKQWACEECGKFRKRDNETRDEAAQLEKLTA